VALSVAQRSAAPRNYLFEAICHALTAMTPQASIRDCSSSAVRQVCDFNGCGGLRDINALIECGRSSRMAIRTWLVGCSMACSLAMSFFASAARAEPIGGVRQSEGLTAPVFSQIPDALDASLPVVANGLNEAVIDVPDDDITLETTVFKPDGAGPFPMIVFNHGKLPGDSHAQPRPSPT